MGREPPPTCNVVDSVPQWCRFPSGKPRWLVFRVLSLVSLCSFCWAGRMMRQCWLVVSGLLRWMASTPRATHRCLSALLHAARRPRLASTWVPAPSGEWLPELACGHHWVRPGRRPGFCRAFLTCQLPSVPSSPLISLPPALPVGAVVPSTARMCVLRASWPSKAPQMWSPATFRAPYCHGTLDSNCWVTFLFPWTISWGLGLYLLELGPQYMFIKCWLAAEALTWECHGSALHFSFHCEQVALCWVSVPAGGTPEAAPDCGGVPARHLDHHAHFGRVGGPVPAESCRGSSPAPGGASGEAKAYEPMREGGTWTPGPRWS